MEGNLQEAKTIPSVSYVDKFFSPLPCDSRFGSNIWMKYAPINGGSKDSTAWTFTLPRMDAPNVYNVRIIQLENWQWFNFNNFNFTKTFINLFLDFKCSAQGNNSYFKSRQKKPSRKNCKRWAR